MESKRSNEQHQLNKQAASNRGLFIVRQTLMLKLPKQPKGMQEHPNFQLALRCNALQRKPDDIKVVVQFAEA